MTPTMTILETSDIWDTDYNSDNWELDFMIIFFTWQFRVTLGSIHNSCYVYFSVLLLSFLSCLYNCLCFPECVWSEILMRQREFAFSRWVPKQVVSWGVRRHQFHIIPHYFHKCRPCTTLEFSHMMWKTREDKSFEVGWSKTNGFLRCEDTSVPHDSTLFSQLPSMYTFIWCGKRERTNLSKWVGLKQVVARGGRRDCGTSFISPLVLPGYQSQILRSW